MRLYSEAAQPIQIDRAGTAPADAFCMRALLLSVILGAAALSSADERPRLRGVETPRATDLLRAKKLAERVEGRLSTPPAHSAGWRHGGSGWEARSDPPAPPPSVTIHIGQPRRRRAPGVPNP